MITMRQYENARLAAAAIFMHRNDVRVKIRRAKSNVTIAKYKAEYATLTTQYNAAAEHADALYRAIVDKEFES